MESSSRQSPNPPLLSMNVAPPPPLTYRRQPNSLPREVSSMPKAEQLARKVTLHYIQTTNSLQHALAQRIEENIYVPPLPDWYSVDFPWKP